MLEAEAAIGLSGGGGEVEEAEISDALAPRSDRALEIHPLEHQWTFWFDNPSACPPQATWGTAIRPIHTFGTVEDFWGLYNNINQINRPSKLPVGANLYCFKKDIEPKWEDPICASGGKWAIISSRGNPGRNDTWWLYTLLPMIGEQFNHGDEICGAVVNIRVKNERISIWTKNGLNEAAQVSIGKQWKEFLDYNGSIGFILHDDAKKHMRAAKNHYMV